MFVSLCTVLFSQVLTCVWLVCVCVPIQKTERYSSYPVYHSVYETFEIVEKFYDPSFKRLRAVAQVRGGLIFLLADSQLLPLDVNQYADSLRKYAQSIAQLAQKHPQEMKLYKVSFGEMILVILCSVCCQPADYPKRVSAFYFLFPDIFRCLVFCCGELHHGIQELPRAPADSQQSRVRVFLTFHTF